MINHNVDPSTLKNSQTITVSQIHMTTEIDSNYSDLITVTKSGFPDKKLSLNPNIREFWEVRHRLSHSDGIGLMILKALRKQILQNLHAAHQGSNSMSARANQTVYWPGMNTCIRNHRNQCIACNQIAPTQLAEPLILTPAPECQRWRTTVHIIRIQKFTEDIGDPPQIIVG